MRINRLSGILLLLAASGVCAAAESAPTVSTVRSGRWSDAKIWDNGKVPAGGSRVLVRRDHEVTYDIITSQPLRSVHIAGLLTFSRERNTRLDVGLLKVQEGEDVSETGFDCTAHIRPAVAVPQPDNTVADMLAPTRGALEVGTAQDPIPAGVSAVIRLTAFEGADRSSLPAIVCCGGRMDFHGAPMSQTWTRLGSAVAKGDGAVSLLDTVTGWHVGDRVLLTATTRQIKRNQTFRPSTKDSTQTEERLITAIDGQKLTLDQAVAFDHTADGDYRGDIANLSRNVVVESADPKGIRGHTMYHRNSRGSISYAEFRHLGKEDVLGRYSLHFHLAGDTMRGTSVIGASIWDSDNRWITIHGTNYLVVRDCVGYQSKGHGFFLENGTEVYNVLDRNLAVQAYIAKKLPDQALPFDANDGSGFWWANSLNAFTRNVAAECDEYGYFFQAMETPAFKLTLDVRRPDGSHAPTDVRTLPFLRFEDNEANCQRRHGFNLGGGVPFGTGVAGVGPDVQHPFVIRNFRVWNSHWSIHPVSPSVMIDRLDCHVCEYGIWRPVYKDHAYRNIRLDQIAVSPEFSPQGRRPVEADYPKPLDIVDDLPPVTVITGHARREGKILVRGTTIDDGAVKSVRINGKEAHSSRANYAEWEIELEAASKAPIELEAVAEDAAGNLEKTPHRLRVEGN
ncbi:G8 domain-containing protein [Humisphaera borealis]|uniref:G8 domain-containing protein n=1 Tax=Humisphaera borealis TaxID=2807512 RepID=A0A7M2WS10_9BACT|nr:G8 domain-containing protein [Humisphaera borealis]QOV88298.1 G8 domain-containing protein [Humisphaera borealis]